MGISAETQSVLAQLSPALGAGEAIFDIIDNVDIINPTITMPNGTEAELTDALAFEIIYGDNDYDRDFIYWR